MAMAHARARRCGKIAAAIRPTIKTTPSDMKKLTMRATNANVVITGTERKVATRS